MGIRTASDIATRAAELVGGDRDREHGKKRQNFENIANHWNAYLVSRRDPTVPLNAADVGHMMVLLKIARTQSGSLNLDDYIDAVGYAACSGEVAQYETLLADAYARQSGKNLDGSDRRETALDDDSFPGVGAEEVAAVTPKFKVGDRARVMKDLVNVPHTKGEIVTVLGEWTPGHYDVRFDRDVRHADGDSASDWSAYADMLEPVAPTFKTGDRVRILPSASNMFVPGCVIGEEGRVWRAVGTGDDGRYVVRVGREVWNVRATDLAPASNFACIGGKPNSPDSVSNTSQVQSFQPEKEIISAVADLDEPLRDDCTGDGQFEIGDRIRCTCSWCQSHAPQEGVIARIRGGIYYLDNDYGVVAGEAVRA